jgi:hypothetical protein
VWGCVWGGGWGVGGVGWGPAGLEISVAFDAMLLNCDVRKSVTIVCNVLHQKSVLKLFIDFWLHVLVH